VTAVLTDERCKLKASGDQILILRDESLNPEEVNREQNNREEVYRVNLSTRAKPAAEQQTSSARVPVA